jgi:hypothetical protein
MDERKSKKNTAFASIPLGVLVKMYKKGKNENATWPETRKETFSGYRGEVKAGTQAQTLSNPGDTKYHLTSRLS